jgi:ZIP family zinc transporter/zinc and cadmium transporter
MNFNAVFAYSVIGGFAALLGTSLVFCCSSWAKKNSVFLVSFAAGVMLSIAFIGLIPESVELAPNVWQVVFIGFLAFYLLQQLVMLHFCHEDDCHVHRFGILSCGGLFIHAFLDGVAIAAGFEAGETLGLLTTLAVLLHEVPQGITITGILMHSQMKTRRVVLFSTGVAAATPVGAVISYFFLRGVSPEILGSLLALTAGSFIYLAAADLLPETHRLHHRANALFFFSGVALISAVGFFLH